MRWIRDALIILALGLALLLGLDWIVGRFFSPDTLRVGDIVSHPAYANEPYDVRELASEHERANRIRVERGRLAFGQPFSGELIHIDEIGATTYRRTTNPTSLEDADRVVLVLGGSTVLGIEVADAYTVPSQLSDALNRDAGERVHVLNGGMQGAESNRVLDRLEWELDHGLRPDLVVVLFGANEVYQGIYHDRPNGPVPYLALLAQANQKRAANREKERAATGGDGDDRARESSTAGRATAMRLLSSLFPAHLFSAIRLQLAKYRTIEPPAHLATPEARAELAERTARIFVENTEEMRRIGEEHGFRLAVFLQPVVYEGDYASASPDVELAIEKAARTLPLLRESFDVGYPALHAALAGLRARGIETADLSRVLESKRTDVFIDFCHLNSVGNGIVGHAIADSL